LIVDRPEKVISNDVSVGMMLVCWGDDINGKGVLYSEPKDIGEIWVWYFKKSTDN